MTLPAGRPVPSPEPDVRERIYISAVRLFSQKGYAATSLREVASEALTTKPMIYYYFGSKEGLYGSIVRQIFEEMADAIRVGLPEGLGAGSAAMAYCERYLDYFLEHDEIIGLVLREVFGLGGQPMADLAATYAERVRQPLDQILAEGMDHGLFRAGNVAACATAVTGILNMFIIGDVFTGTPFERETPLVQAQVYIDGLLAPSSAPAA